MQIANVGDLHLTMAPCRLTSTYVLLHELILDRVLVDARIAFTLTKNDVLFSVFFPDDLISPPVIILNKWSRELEFEVKDLQSNKVGANFQFRATERSI
jgi:hypothetical protein